MIPSEEIDVLRVHDFETEEKHDGLKWIVASIYKVSNEDKARVWRFSCWIELKNTDFKEFENVIELSMNISDKIDGWGDELYVGLIHENFLNLFAYFFDSTFLDDFFFLDLLHNVLNIHMFVNNDKNYQIQTVHLSSSSF